MEDSLTSGFATATELTHSLGCRSSDKQWCISLHCLWFPEHAGILCSVTCSHQTNTMPRLAWQSQARQDYTSFEKPDRGRDKILDPRAPSYHASRTTHFWVQLDKPNHNLDRPYILLHRHRHFLNKILP